MASHTDDQVEPNSAGIPVLLSKGAREKEVSDGGDGIPHEEIHGTTL